MELIIAVVIVIVLLIALKVYTYKKARYYRELGYSIVPLIQQIFRRRMLSDLPS
jgi:hypothetical protein